jgi:ribosomal protein L7/L12
MPTVIFTGVVPRARVVSLITLVQNYTRLRLKEAKEAVERVLEGHPVEFAVVDGSRADEFAREARELGALVAE